MMTVSITGTPLQVDATLQSVAAHAAGAINVFVGTVRDNTGDKKVVRLEYEAYSAMAVKEIEKIITQARQQWPLLSAAVHHRVGELVPGDIAVIIAVATPHRAASFAACQYIIDTIKTTVPIWKKEIYDDGQCWVAAYP